MTEYKCAYCGSYRLWSKGLRYTKSRGTLKRLLCKECGKYTYVEPTQEEKIEYSRIQKVRRAKQEAKEETKELRMRLREELEDVLGTDLVVFLEDYAWVIAMFFRIEDHSLYSRWERERLYELLDALKEL